MTLAETLSVISLVSFIVSGVCIILAIFFWIKFKIPLVIGDLSGRTAKKSIEKMREFNDKSGVKVYKPSEINVNRGKLTDSIPNSKGISTDRKSTELNKTNITPETGILWDNKSKKTIIEETQMLVDENETGLLVDGNETELLEQQNFQQVKPISKIKLTMLEEVIITDTNEVI